MSYLTERATCVMCGRGVHNLEGRVACDGCNLPTDCCLCQEEPPRAVERRTGRG